MYNEKLIPLLDDLEDKDIEIAGGSTVGMVLSITNSLIKYICNLTINKKKYENVQNDVLKIKKEAEELKIKVLKIIDKDKEILEKILLAYKERKENIEKYINTCKEATEYCIEVTESALETLQLADRISKVGNKMLSSDFEICKLYSYAAIKARIVNVNINLNSIEDQEYNNMVKNKYTKILEEAKNIYSNF